MHKVIEGSVLVAADIKNINIGDYAIFESLADSLLVEGFEHVYKLSDHYSQGKNKTMINLYNPFSLLKGFVKVKALYIGGGGIFQDDTSIWNVLYFAVICLLGLMFRKKILIKSVGVTPLHSMVSRYLVLWMCQVADFVSVRDQPSLDNLYELGVTTVVIEEDLALSFNPSRSQGLMEEKFKALKETTYFVVSIRPVSKADESFLNDLSKCISELGLRRGAIPLFVPFHGGQDVGYIKRFISDYYSDEALFYEDVSAAEYLFLAAGADLILSMRLHGLILASRFEVPIFAINYNDKVSYFMESIGKGDFCFDMEGVKSLLEFEKSLKV